MTPGEFDHPAAHAGVARFGETSLAPSLAALVWSSGETGIARQGPTIPDLSRGSCHKNGDSFPFQDMMYPSGEGRLAEARQAAVVP